VLAVYDEDEEKSIGKCGDNLRLRLKGVEEDVRCVLDKNSIKADSWQRNYP